MKNQPSILREILDRPGQELDLNKILEEIELLRQLGIKSAGFFSEIIRRLDSIPIDSVDQPSLLIH
jgi:hypothetical protein